MIHVAISICLLISVELIGSTEAADCSTITCDNGGTCNNHTDSPPCLCPLPYIAPYCESAADYCFTLQPDKRITKLPVCLNGGNCTLAYTDPYFNCSCPDGFTGWRCEVRVGEEETTEFSTTTTTTAATEQSTASEQSQISTVVVIATACVASLLTGAVIVVGGYLIRSRRHKIPQIKKPETTGTGNSKAHISESYN
ncbi:hypothetical protein BOX15_Mlig023257g1 [Macrostomum lignano]|uniref:EGF-like domain-containing protein n=1 Tax=Macrostomum lignano TaxID=282301 RepID=A0A267GSR2_9PLAT|nr:hypothetical protein BOX15_Mlig023257g1 [Macrostomum lignano]